MNNILAVYRPGKLHLETVIKGNNVAYSDRNKEEYLASLKPGYLILPMEEAIAMIHKVEEKICGEWKPITLEEWTEALECLPPEKWEHCAGVEIFRMCEYWTSNITAHYAQFKEHYYTALRQNTTPYSTIAAEIATLARR